MKVQNITSSYWYESTYSPSHMSAYSSIHDQLILGTINRFFMVIPENKRLSYLGMLHEDSLYKYISLHHIKNGNQIWFLGGSRFEMVKEGVDSPLVPRYFHGEEFLTNVANLE